MTTLSDLLSSTEADFVNVLGGIYEHSSWVAEKLYHDMKTENPPFSSITSIGELHSSMKRIVDSSSQSQKLELVRLHPDLGKKAAELEQLTDSSKEEQSSAGLDSLSPDEFSKFTAWNEEYKKKFGFPFILAVRNATKYTVMAALRARVANTYEVEFGAALKQIHKIGWMRILSAVDIIPKGFLTCHVLDTANGCPASGMRVILHRLSPDPLFIKEFILNQDGRLPAGPALKGAEFRVGEYEWTFFVNDYFESMNNETSGVPFLGVVPLRFGIDDPDSHYHVPLLASPWSFSSYRGS